jgi:hypothetical protein
VTNVFAFFTLKNFVAEQTKCEKFGNCIHRVDNIRISGLADLPVIIFAPHLCTFLFSFLQHSPLATATSPGVHRLLALNHEIGLKVVPSVLLEGLLFLSPVQSVHISLSHFITLTTRNSPKYHHCIVSDMFYSLFRLLISLV